VCVAITALCISNKCQMMNKNGVSQRYASECWHMASTTKRDRREQLVCNRVHVHLCAVLPPCDNDDMEAELLKCRFFC
jgi:hypothetical protein